MIHAFNFTCNRDMELAILMGETLKKHCPGVSLSYTNTDTTPAYKDYGNGSGWEASMMKLKALRDIVKTHRIQDTDFVLSVDSDVVFCTPEVFEYVKPEYGLIGIQHQQFYPTRFGAWGHMSGALIFFRGDVAKKMAELSEQELNIVRFNHFKPFNMTENEDVVLSYLAKFVVSPHSGGTNDFCLPGSLSSGDFEGDVYEYHYYNEEYQNDIGSKLHSFYHLNYCPTQFLGEPVDGKWSIPKVLKQKGIGL
jgi:hypothetical protein